MCVPWGWLLNHTYTPNTPTPITPQEELRNAFQALVLSGGPDIRAVVVDASGVSHLDLTGVEAIDFMHSMLLFLGGLMYTEGFWGGGLLRCLTISTPHPHTSQPTEFAAEKGIKLVFANAKGIFRERLKSSKIWSKIGAEAYENLSVDEVVTKLLREEGVGATEAMQDLHWGSPKLAGVAAAAGAGGGGSKNVALRRGASGKSRPVRKAQQRLPETVAEGDEEEGEGGRGEGVGQAMSASLSPPVFAGNVNMYWDSNAGNGGGKV